MHEFEEMSRSLLYAVLFPWPYLYLMRDMIKSDRPDKEKVEFCSRKIEELISVLRKREKK